MSRHKPYKDLKGNIPSRWNSKSKGPHEGTAWCVRRKQGWHRRNVVSSESGTSHGTLAKSLDFIPSVVKTLGMF